MTLRCQDPSWPNFSIIEKCYFRHLAFQVGNEFDRDTGTVFFFFLNKKPVVTKAAVACKRTIEKGWNVDNICMKYGAY